ncbi:MAG: hypothetical protein L6R42_010953, partial [Xanthoria sp. 1 TBL-2021]
MAMLSTFNQRIKAAKAVSDDENSTTSLSDENVELARPVLEDDETISIERQSDGEATSEEPDVATISFGALAKAQE